MRNLIKGSFFAFPEIIPIPSAKPYSTLQGSNKILNENIQNVSKSTHSTKTKLPEKLQKIPFFHIPVDDEFFQNFPRLSQIRPNPRFPYPTFNSLEDLFEILLQPFPQDLTIRLSTKMNTKPLLVGRYSHFTNIQFLFTRQKSC